METVFDACESKVRSYCRAFPAVFTRAIGATLFDETGRRYIDFLAGAGTLNYGHNNPRIRSRVMEYLHQEGIIHGLDMYTPAKRDFLQVLNTLILQPRNLDYKVQFPGPTGTNAVEAAMKLARKYTNRTGIVAFTNGYHGMTAGSLAATGNEYHRKSPGCMAGNVTFMPYDGYFGPGVDTITYLERFINDASSGLDLPAAVLLETVQGEGGVNVAGFDWLRRLDALCRRHQILLIVDDIQAGCGRTGTFFSFTPAGIVPDIVTLSKSIGAYGLPLSLVLMKPELDCWEPGEHNGTFRGNNLAFVAAVEAFRLYWSDHRFNLSIGHKGHVLHRRLQTIARESESFGVVARGRGMFAGLVFDRCPKAARLISRAAFERGLILETCGGQDHVVKFLPPLTIEENLLQEGLDITAQAVREVLERLGRNGPESLVDSEGEGAAA